MMNTFPAPVRRAEGLPAGCDVSINFWALDPAQELPGRLCPMSVLPPPEASLPRRIAAVVTSLGSTVAAGLGLMVLAAYLTTL